MWQRSIDAVILTGTKTSFVGGLPEVQGPLSRLKIMRIGNTTTPLRHVSSCSITARIETHRPAALSYFLRRHYFQYLLFHARWRLHPKPTNICKTAVAKSDFASLYLFRMFPNVQ